MKQNVSKLEKGILHICKYSKLSTVRSSNHTWLFDSGIYLPDTPLGYAEG